MHLHRSIASLVLVAVSALGALAAPPSHAAATLRPYASEAELGTALERWRAAGQQRRADRARQAPGMAQSMMAPAAPAPAAAMADAAAAAESITNVQTAGVDEGGIVKRAGEHLVILRRGRLFTVRVGGDQLQAVSTLDAFAPGSDPRGAWYDELLVSGSTVVVVGYSYARGGTEIGLFDIGADGTLAYRATYHLRSFDYYSARNYASRLIGRRLVFYTPVLLQPWGQPWSQSMPALRRWGGAVPGEFERILPATRVYRSDDEFDPEQPLALHTVTGCELGDAALRCESSAVLAPAGRVFYVSAGSVYVWTNGTRRPSPPALGREDVPVSQSAVFRLPLDGSAPSGLKTAGVPTDQMSFLEDGQGHLNVLLREYGAGEGMWGWQRGAGRLALLRLPLSALGDGRGAALREHYRRLPDPERGALQNRFVGDWLLWGAGDKAWALRFAAGAPAVALAPGHAVERIEALAGQALLVGNAGSDLHFSAVRLSRAEAHLEGRHVQPGSRQGETRSHGFFYRATAADEGLVGLPILGGAASARVLVLRERGLSFTALGALNAQAAARGDDACKASCTDWYGNARPIFLGDRVLALMGYEIVEGQLNGRADGERIDERRRLDFAPQPRTRSSGRPTPFD